MQKIEELKLLKEHFDEELKRPKFVRDNVQFLYNLYDDHDQKSIRRAAECADGV